jgi:hypothetical protein
MTLSLLFLAPAAEAMIQVDNGIAGARLGNTRAEVRAALGKPAKTATGSNDFGPFVRYTFAGGVRVVLPGQDHVTSVDDDGPRRTGPSVASASVRARRR